MRSASGVKRPKIKSEASGGVGHLHASTPDSALADLEENGYFWLPGVVPKELCERCARAIQSDVGKRLDAGSRHQEEPIERLDAETGEIMLQVRDFVLERVMNGLLGADAVVPSAWTDTLYGRVKRKHFHTKWHCDAFNTVFQRGLLQKENLPENQVINPKWEEFRANGRLRGSWKDVPIFTFWVALRPVTTEKASHLRIYPKSHRLSGMELHEDMKNVVPEGFRYSPKNFVGPIFPGGYEVGDIVVFHCLTQHEANSHQETQKAHQDGSGERISMDGRFFMALRIE